MAELGVEINLSKSRLCDKVDNKVVNSRAEFLKRLFINGKEVSPLPLRLLESGNVTDESMFIVNALNRGRSMRDKVCSQSLEFLLTRKEAHIAAYLSLTLNKPSLVQALSITDTAENLIIQ
jgi:hypothetical protein